MRPPDVRLICSNGVQIAFTVGVPLVVTIFLFFWHAVRFMRSGFLNAYRP